MGDATLRLEEVVGCYRHRPRYGWPQPLAALVKSDVGIRRNSCP